MRHGVLVGMGVLLVVLHVRSLAAVVAPLPLRNGRPVVATINRESISLDEFVAQLSPPVDRQRLRQGRATATELELLERLVTVKLVVTEATTMGLAELPEIQKQVEVTSREILREVLLKRVVKDVKPDPVAVEKLFRELVREWKTTSLLFNDEAGAQRARKELDGGAPYAAVAERAVAAKAARVDHDNGYHPRKDYLPAIVDAIGPLKAGQVSPVIRLQAGYVVVKVIDIRYPENREARAEARKKVLEGQQQTALKAHDDALRQQHAVINKALLKGLDYEAARPGADALMKDKRPVAEIKGGAPITVGDLTDYLRMQFFHGDDKVRQAREMNSKKEAGLDAMLSRRLLNMEAVRLGLDKTNEYRDRVNGYRESLVFDAFVQKVIAPGNKMKEEEVKQYYDAHRKEYSNPTMIKARSLAFSRRSAAETGIRKLREGTDYGWLVANAEGQVDKAAPDLLKLDGKPVMTSTMPEGFQKALAGAKSGEYRLYESPQGYVYVLAIDQVIQPDARPYEEVREDIAKKLYSEKLKKSVSEYAGKLRAHSKVATYLTKA